MRTTVTLETRKLDRLMRVTRARSKAAAVSRAVDEYLKIEASRSIKALKGTLRFDLTAEEIRHRGR